MAQAQKKNIGLIIFIGIICSTLPFVIIMICNNLSIFNSSILQGIKGFIIGISFTPISIFTGIMIQDKDIIPANKQLLTSSILGVSYSILLLISIINMNVITSQLGAISTFISGIFNILVIPQLILIILATIFTIIATVTNKHGFALAGAIIFTITLCIPMLVLGYIGASKIKYINQELAFDL
jgi:hypothetical protein